MYDDNKDRRESLKILINIQLKWLAPGIFKDCLNVWNDIVNNQPDVILMDIDMPDMSGIEGVKMIRKQYPDVKIIMQTVFDDTDKIFAAIEAGADGYFLKQRLPQNCRGYKRSNGRRRTNDSYCSKKCFQNSKNSQKNVTEVLN